MKTLLRGAGATGQEGESPVTALGSRRAIRAVHTWTFSVGGLTRPPSAPVCAEGDRE
jgi:hypothetical protein